MNDLMQHQCWTRPPANFNLDIVCYYWWWRLNLAKWWVLIIIIIYVALPHIHDRFSRPNSISFFCHSASCHYKITVTITFKTALWNGLLWIYPNIYLKNIFFVWHLNRLRRKHNWIKLLRQIVFFFFASAATGTSLINFAVNRHPPSRWPMKNLLRLKHFRN